jgi:hypothetical protein
VQQKANKLEKE